MSATDFAPDPDAVFDLLCCHEGMAAVRAEHAEPLWRDARRGAPVEITGSDTAVLLPRCRKKDMVLPQPPLALRLRGHEVAELSDAMAGGPFAITCFGPEQDKSRNEDAALSAIIRGPDGSAFSFAAVADGVSTRTFWAERASRLACIAAYRAVRTFLWDHEFSDAGVRRHFAARLTEWVRSALRSDRDWLRSMPEVSPPDWAPDLYRRYAGRDDFWYNSTLLVTCLGPLCGLAYWVGDGAVVIDKTAPNVEPVHNQALRSDADLEISSFVSLLAPMDFVGAPVSYAVNETQAAGIHVLLGSDGIDRTLQSSAALRETALSIAAHPLSALQRMESLWQMPGAERDNYSLAWASWPLDGGRRLATRRSPSPSECVHTPAAQRGGGPLLMEGALPPGDPPAPLAPTADAARAAAIKSYEEASAGAKYARQSVVADAQALRDIISDIGLSFSRIKTMYNHKIAGSEYADERVLTVRYKWIILEEYFSDKIFSICSCNSNELSNKIINTVDENLHFAVNHYLSSVDHRNSIRRRDYFKSIISYLRGEATGLENPRFLLGQYDPKELCRALEVCMRDLPSSEIPGRGSGPTAHASTQGQD